MAGRVRGPQGRTARHASAVVAALLRRKARRRRLVRADEGPRKPGSSLGELERVSRQKATDISFLPR